MVETIGQCVHPFTQESRRCSYTGHEQPQESAAEQERLSARAGAKAAYLSADAQVKATLGINADWL